LFTYIRHHYTHLITDIPGQTDLAGARMTNYPGVAILLVVKISSAIHFHIIILITYIHRYA